MKADMSVHSENLIIHFLQIIYQRCQSKFTENADPSLFTGQAGIVLFCWYWQKFQQQHPAIADIKPLTLDAAVMVNQLLQQSQLQSSGSASALHLPGVAWLLELLLQQSDYDADFNRAYLWQLQQALSALLQWSGEIELTLGLAGLAVFVRRRAMADPDAVQTYQQILRLCAGLAVYPQPGQAYWPTAVGSFFRKDSTLVTEVNLGLAHGMPAVLATIIPAVSIPGLSSQASELLSAGCQWLLQQQLPQAESCFPYRAGTGADSRLGWCYGDLSVALLLARAGQALQSAALLKEARRIALHAAARQQQSARVTDAALCHGSAGLMLQFRLLQQFFPDQALAEAACYWRQLTLQLLPVAIEQLDCGLLNGTAGIGLALLVELGADTVWTEALLLS